MRFASTTRWKTCGMRSKITDRPREKRSQKLTRTDSKPISPSPPIKAHLPAPPSAARAPRGGAQRSPRGRPRLLWDMLSGALRKEGFKSEAVHQALDLCLSCKACKSECPVQVDVAAWKSEFLAQHYKRRLHPLHHYIFGFADKLARWGSLTPALTNALLTGPFTSPLIKHIAGVAQARQLPPLPPRNYQQSRPAGDRAEKPPGGEEWQF